MVLKVSRILNHFLRAQHALVFSFEVVNSPVLTELVPGQALLFLNARHVSVVVEFLHVG